MFLMSASGSASRTSRSAILPASIVPRSSRPAANAPLLRRRHQRLHRRHAQLDQPLDGQDGADAVVLRLDLRRARQLRRRGPVVVGADGDRSRRRAISVCALTRRISISTPSVGGIAPQLGRGPAPGPAPWPPPRRPSSSPPSLSLRCFCHASPVMVLTSIEQTMRRSTIVATRASGSSRGPSTSGCWMRSMPAVDRQPQAVGRRGVGLGLAAALVRLLDHHPLRLGREADERRPGEVRRAAELDEVRPLVEVGVDRDAQLLGGHVHQVLAGALRDLVVHLLLEQRQAALGNQAERHRVRARPSRRCCRRRGCARRGAWPRRMRSRTSTSGGSTP